MSAANGFPSQICHPWSGWKENLRRLTGGRSARAVNDHRLPSANRPAWAVMGALQTLGNFQSSGLVVIGALQTIGMGGGCNAMSEHECHECHELRGKGGTGEVTVWEVLARGGERRPRGEGEVSRNGTGCPGMLLALKRET